MAPDIFNLLVEAGVRGLKESGEEINGSCPMHKDRIGRSDTHASWSINRTNFLHHCLAGDERVLTRSGVFPIRDLAGHDVEVLDGDGNWTLSPIRSYGVQPLLQVTLRRNGIERSVYTTAGHRWIVTSRNSKGRYHREVVTSSLRAGQRIDGIVAPRWEGSLLREHVQQGFVFGDGTTQSDRKTRVTFHGAKLEMAAWFDKPATGVLPTVGSLPSHWKGLPVVSGDALASWLAGYFAADGCISGDGQGTLTSSQRDHVQFVADACARLGIPCGSVRQTTRQGYLSEPAPLYCISVDLPASLVLRSKHLVNHQVKPFNRMGWTVVAVAATERVEEVFCAEVPTTHSFVLDGGLLTGNCFSCGYSGTLTGLLMDLQGYVPDDLEMVLATSTLQRKVARIAEPEPESKAPTEWELSNTLTPVPPRLLALRQLRPDAADAYGVRWDPQMKSWVLPVRDEHGVLLGAQYRQKGVVLNRPTGLEKAVTLFGFSEMRHHDEVALVESPLDAVRLYGLGIPAISSFGAWVSETQMRMMSRNFSTVVLALDNDKVGQEALAFVAAQLRRWGTGVYRFRYDGLTADDGAEAKDPGDVASDDALIRNYRLSMSRPVTIPPPPKKKVSK